MKKPLAPTLVLLGLAIPMGAEPRAATNPSWEEIDRRTQTVLPKVIAWRRDIDLHDRIRRTAENIAEAAGASATVKITFGNVVTYNDPALTQHMGPTLKRVALAEHWNPNGRVTTTAEDFADYQQKVPGLFFFICTGT